MVKSVNLFQNHGIESHGWVGSLCCTLLLRVELLIIIFLRPGKHYWLWYITNIVNWWIVTYSRKKHCYIWSRFMIESFIMYMSSAYCNTHNMVNSLNTKNLNPITPTDHISCPYEMDGRVHSVLKGLIQLSLFQHDSTRIVLH